LKIAHLADLHLGFRRFTYDTASGINQREHDVAQAAAQAFAMVLEAKPDVVLIAGDVFHSVRPPNRPILQLFGWLQALRAAGIPVVMVAGDHDTPRSRDSGSLLGLYRALDVHVAIDEPKLVQLAGLPDIVAVPDIHLRFGRPIPDPLRDTILLAHGNAIEMPGVPARLPKALYSGWLYAALGHWHVFKQMAPMAYYAGAIEYTSTDPWSEARQQVPKGWLLVEPGACKVTQMLTPARPHVDLPIADAEQYADADSLAHAILERLAPLRQGAVVRQIVENVPLVWRASVMAAARAEPAVRHLLHIQLELRRKATRASFAFEMSTPAKAERPNLREQLAEYLQVAPLAADVNREDFVREGLAALDAVTPHEEQSNAAAVRVRDPAPPQGDPGQPGQRDPAEG